MESGVFVDSFRLLNSCLVSSTRPLPLSRLPLICRRKRDRRLVLENVVSAPPKASSWGNASRDDYVLVSTTECSDGSMIFCFGDEGDIAKNTEMEKQLLLLQKDSGIEVNDKQTRIASRMKENLMADIVLCSGAASLPHAHKALAGGEDFYFVDQSWLGIADGAGQWSFEGTSAPQYAQVLIKNCEKIVSEIKSTSVLDPAEVLCKAAARTLSCGLSTALVAFFDGQALLVAHVGNSGFVIIRDGNVFERSCPMMHEFYFPVQIKEGNDPSELVEEYKLDLEEGDVVIFATNGLFDNLYEQEVTSIVSRSLENGSTTPQQIAESLAMRAYEVGQMASGRTPFADAAQAAGYTGFTGGKLDDVTVIVSLVQDRASSCLQ